MQVDIAVLEIAQGRLYNNLSAILRPVPVKSKSPLEEQAFEFLTPFAFKKFQEEFLRASQYSIICDQGNTFIVRYFQGETPKNHILCRHILRVFFHRDCFKIPSFCLPIRWYRNALETTCAIQDGALDATSVVHNEVLQSICEV